MLKYLFYLVISFIGLSVISNMTYEQLFNNYLYSRQDHLTLLKFLSKFSIVCFFISIILIVAFMVGFIAFLVKRVIKKER